MPVPLQDIASEEPAALAYLRFVKAPNDGSIQGALFVTNGRGDPLEFCFTLVESPTGPLWEPGRAYRQAVASLARALFEAVNHEPDLLLALAEEMPSDVLADDICPATPACLVAGGAETPGVAVRWVGQEPAEDSEVALLVQSLRSRNLLREPFDRAVAGLEEAFAY